MRSTSDLITVTYGGDLALLYYQALSIEKFWKDNKIWTIIVEDQAIHQRVIDWINIHIIPQMPDWQVNICTGPKLVATDGWYRQQILKLWAASESKAKYSVILDSKNVFIRETKFEDFFDNNRLKVSLFDKDDSTRPGLDQLATCKLLGVDVNTVSEIFPVTPFIWRNDLVRELLTTLTEINYDIYSLPTLKTSESSLYWVYAQDKIPWVKTSQDTLFGQYGGFTKDDRLSVEELKNKLEAADEADANIVTLHRCHVTPESADMFGEFLRMKGLVDDHKIAFFRETFREIFYRLRPKAVEILHKEWNLLPLRSFIRNGQTIKFNRIVAYGCSHTAGSELADHLFWKTPISLDELDNLKRKIKDPTTFYEKYFPKPVFTDLAKAQQELSWVAKLAKKLDVPISNRSRAGNSMQGIIYDIERDIFDLHITDYDLIVVGVTSPDRWMYLNNDSEYNWPGVRTPMFGWSKWWPTEQLHNDFVKYILTDYFVFYNYYTSLRYLDLLSKNYEGRILIQFVHHTIQDYVKFTKNEKLNQRFVEMMLKINNFSSIVDTDLSLGNLINWSDNSQIHGFKHIREEFHEQFADKFLERLLNNE